MSEPSGLVGLPRSRPLGQRLLRGGSWAMLGKVLTMPVALGLAVVLARVLSPAELGGYFLATSFAAFLIILVQLGLGRAMIKLVAGALATDRPALALRAIRIGATTFVVAAVTVVALMLTPPGAMLLGLLEDGQQLIVYLPWIALIVAGLATTDFAAEILRGFHDLRSASLLADQLLQRLLLVLLLVVLWALGTRVELGLVLGLAALTAALAATLGIVIVMRHRRLLERQPASGKDGPGVWEVLRQGPPFLLMRLNFWLLTGAGIWVLGMYRPAEEVAVYGAAAYLALLVQAPTVAINNVLMPVASELLSRRDNSLLERVARGAAGVAGLPSFALALLLLFAGGFVLGLAFGPAYAAGHMMVAILALGRCTGVALGPCPILLTMSDHQRDVAIVMTVTSLATLLGLIAVAPTYGGVGIALVVAVAIVVQSLVLAWLTYQRLQIAVWPELSLPAIRRLLRHGG
jgi:O-antigen/teichoic acid export membrane protein